MSRERIAIGFVAGAVVGVLVARFVAPGDFDAPTLAEWHASRFDDRERPSADRSVQLADGARRIELPTGSVADRAPSSLFEREESRVDDRLFDARLREHGRDGLREGWTQVRPDVIPSSVLDEGLGRFEEVVLTSPRAIGRELGERATRREAAEEDARTGGVFALLESLDAGGVGPLLDHVSNPATFDAYFERAIGEKTVDGPGNREAVREVLEDGVTVVFPAGVFALSKLLPQSEMPRDVTIAGAGRERTLLVLTEDLFTLARLRNFTIRDCTLFTDSNSRFDLRAEPASISLERVRLIGFDSGAGGSSALNTRALALRAVDCVFAGGYGRSPSHCGIFDVRTDALLARFDRCRFERVQLRVRRIRPGATVVLEACELVDMLDDAAQDAEGHAGVALLNTTFTRFAGGWDAVPSKDLNDLFPGWRERMED